MCADSVVANDAIEKPTVFPVNPSFSSGPCPKRPGWDANVVAKRAFLGRSHRAAKPKAQIQELNDKMRAQLGMPDNYRLGILPASDTGAFEAAMWSLLGARPVDVLAWESFGKGWVTDIVKQLKIDANVIEADYGVLPDLSQVRKEADVVFTWNGTTSGVRVPNGDWIADDHEGLIMADATSAVFAQSLPWEKLDVVTFSWQKVLGGEGAHGVLILSPKAVERLETYAPEWPLPKIFRLTKNGKVNEGIFKADTINTPSMLAVADALDAIDWMANMGGAAAIEARADDNFRALQTWVDSRAWIDNLAVDPKTRSNTSVCLKIVDNDITALDTDAQAAFAKAIVKRLDVEGAAYDLGSYRDAPAGLRIWCGTTVERRDVEILTAWLDYAFAVEKSTLLANA